MHNARLDPVFCVVIFFGPRFFGGDMALRFNQVSENQQLWLSLIRGNGYQNESYRAKANRIEGIFNSDDFFTKYCNVNVTVTLQTLAQNGSVSSTLGVGYTYINEHNHNNIVIMHSSWYFENYSLGFCIGLLCHELGAHSLVDQCLTEDELNNETINEMNRIPDIGPDFVIPGNCNQRDHAYAAVPGNARFKFYQELVISIAHTMFTNTENFAGDHNEVRYLFDCYLMDIASIFSTGDHRAQGIVGDGPARLARVFNNKRQFLIEYLNDTNRGILVPFVPAAKTQFDIIGDYAQVLYSLTSAVSWNWSTGWAPWNTPV